MSPIETRYLQEKPMELSTAFMIMGWVGMAIGFGLGILVGRTIWRVSE